MSCFLFRLEQLEQGKENGDGEFGSLGRRHIGLPGTQTRTHSFVSNITPHQMRLLGNLRTKFQRGYAARWFAC